MRQTTRGPKIFLSLLALCYLEVRYLAQVWSTQTVQRCTAHAMLLLCLQIVLWTACLLFTAQGSALPGEALAGQVYLRRETVS